MLLRTVEKQLGSIDDPPLAPEGEQRAQRLAQMFGDASARGGLEAIYVSDDRRAQQTAAPLAQRLHRAPQLFSAGDARSAAARVLREHAGDTVLVIGSGATVPQMIHELNAVDLLAAAPAEPDVLYLVTVPSFCRPHLVRIRL